MLTTIKYLHLQKICHRDIKAENFVFNKEENNHIALIDFGLAYEWKDDMREEINADGGNKIMGTVYYVAPEVLKKDYDESCDIWSLGVILYELLYGFCSYTSSSIAQLVNKIQNT